MNIEWLQFYSDNVGVTVACSCLRASQILSISRQCWRSDRLSRVAVHLSKIEWEVAGPEARMVNPTLGYSPRTPAATMQAAVYGSGLGTCMQVGTRMFISQLILIDNVGCSVPRGQCRSGSDVQLWLINWPVGPIMTRLCIMSARASASASATRRALWRGSCRTWGQRGAWGRRERSRTWEGF